MKGEQEEKNYKKFKTVKKKIFICLQKSEFLNIYLLAKKKNTKNIAILLVQPFEEIII